MGLGPVSSRLTRKAVLLHDALKPFSFGAADYIDKLSWLKLVHLDAQISFQLRSVWQPKFSHEFFRFGIRLLEMSNQRFGDLRFLLRIKADLHSDISGRLRVLDLEDGVAARFDHGDRRSFSLRVVDTRHPDFPT